MEIEQITRVLTQYAAYEKETGSTSMDGFGFWLLNQKKAEIGQEDLTQLHRDIGYHLNRVNKYSKYLSRYFLDQLEIDSLDEFSFLTAIHVLDAPSKTEVYDFTITELTTGQQMMRRLVKKGLVEEYPDEADQRKKRLRLSKKGKSQQSLAFSRIGEESNMKFGSLDTGSKHLLLKLLKQLDTINATNLARLRSGMGFQ